MGKTQFCWLARITSTITVAIVMLGQISYLLESRRAIPRRRKRCDPADVSSAKERASRQAQGNAREEVGISK